MQLHSLSKTICVAIDLIGDYQSPILDGIRNQANLHGYGVAVFVGRELNPRGVHDLPAHEIYDLIGYQTSGVIVLSGTLGDNLSDRDFKSFIDHFAPLPTVSIARATANIPTIMTDNQTSMRQLMEHMVVTRGFQRIAFMGGSPGNLDALERETAFREVLEEHGLLVIPELMMTGNFVRSAAREAMLELLKSGQDFEAVIAANDEMAYGILQVLNEAGIRIPEDIAVTGFDDTRDSQFTTPPLTTVHQPLVEQGEQAVQLLLQMLQHQTVALEVRIPGELVIRASCGYRLISNKPTEIHLRTISNVHSEFLQAIAPLQSLSAAQASELFEALIQNALEPSATNFMYLWQKLLQKGQDRTLWTGVSLLREHGLRLMPDLPSSQQLLKLCNKAQMLLETRRLGESTRHQLGGRNNFYAIHQLERSFMAALGLKELFALIPDMLPFLGIKRCFIVLYESFGPSVTINATLRFAYDTQRIQNHDLNPFVSSQLLPGDLTSHLSYGMMFVHPLFVNDVHYGFILTDASDDEHLYHETLRTLVGNSIHNLVQTNALKSYAASLEERILQRTNELERANRQLNTQIKQRRDAENALLEANAKLRQAALTDGLTGVYNRSAFDDYFERQWKHHYRYGRPLSLMLCDIDYFKRFNDTYGHVHGDECLRVIAQVIQESAQRAGDMVARYGGEEFAIIMVETDEAGAEIVARRVHQAVIELGILHQASDVSQTVTLSIGVCTMTPNDRQVLNEIHQPHTLIEAADRALYAAKNAGRNRLMQGSLTPVLAKMK